MAGACGPAAQRAGNALWGGRARPCLAPACGRKLAVTTHPLTGTRFCCQISSLRRYRAAAALKVIVGEMSVVRPVAMPLWSFLLERYWSEAEHLSNGLESGI